MTVIPILLDVRPRYLGRDSTSASLLRLPTGNGTLLREITERVAEVTARAPIILPNFATDSGYEREIRTACSRVESVTTAASFRESLGVFDPSDALLLVAPNIHPTTGFDFRQLMGEEGDSAMVRHLLAFEANSFRTKEFVHRTDDGRVRRIQRFFDPVTWPFPAGVIASLVPIMCLHADPGLPLASLDDLRRACAGRGIPSQDVRYYGSSFDMNDEEGALALSERNVIAAGRRLETREVPRTLFSTIHPTARVFGPVFFGEGVSLEEGALVIGPAVLGDGARVRRNAVVAQCLVLPGADIAEGVTLRQRVVIQRRSRTGVEVREQRRSMPWPGPTATVTNSSVSAPTYQITKAAVEPLIAFFALLLLSPLMALIAGLVKLGSTGPAFYADRREGKDGRPFSCWKFRTMHINADAMQQALAAKQEMDGPQFKMGNDPRVTDVGRWLRRSSVDELPQLINVLLGDMSLIGPRPSPFRENQICIPWRNGRLSVRPGMTGLWQICRRDRAQGDFHQWIYYDLLYVRHVNPWVDLKILAATVRVLCGRPAIDVADIIPGLGQTEVQPTCSEIPQWADRANDSRTVPNVAAAQQPEFSSALDCADLPPSGRKSVTGEIVWSSPKTAPMALT